MKKTIHSTILLFGFSILSTTLSGQTTTNYGTESGTLGTNNSFFGYRSGKVITASGTDNVFIGSQAGLANTSAKRNVFIGTNTGLTNTIGNNNTFIGNQAGKLNLNGASNVFLGYKAGLSNTDGSNNMFVGEGAGENNDHGSENVFLGASAGAFSTSGNQNLYLGSAAGNSNLTGSENVFLGYYAGSDNNGSGNIFIGTNAGYSTLGDSLLIIDNTNTTSPLIYGNFATNQLGVNTDKFATGYALSVNGGIICKELKVQAFSSWPDYVFKSGYQLLPLEKVEKHIQQNGHLPNISSAEEVAKDGYIINELNVKLLEKIEELTLYLIQQNKEIAELKSRISSVESK